MFQQGLLPPNREKKTGPSAESFIRKIPIVSRREKSSRTVNALDSTVPLSPVDAGLLFSRQGRCWVCEDMLHDGKEVVPVERRGQKGESPSFNPMAVQFFIKVPRHQDSAETTPNPAGTNRHVMTIQVRELVGS